MAPTYNVEASRMAPAFLSAHTVASLENDCSRHPMSHRNLSACASRPNRQCRDVCRQAMWLGARPDGAQCARVRRQAGIVVLFKLYTLAGRGRARAGTFGVCMAGACQGCSAGQSAVTTFGRVVATGLDTMHALFYRRGVTCRYMVCHLGGPMKLQLASPRVDSTEVQCWECWHAFLRLQPGRHCRNDSEIELAE